ncbi:unnamed protein product [Rotaria sordida]|uniref:Uncharacterized protein n=1 Tax=Rotaria sordida TaxID=392033 RepID=A0A819UPG1_9BILA|nr:unnamed protein product [Rotaria sordida]
MTNRNNISHSNSNRGDYVDGSSSDEVNVQITANEGDTLQTVIDDPRFSSSNEVSKIEENVTAPSEDACQMIIPLTHPTVLPILKPLNPIHPNDESSEKNTARKALQFTQDSLL